MAQTPSAWKSDFPKNAFDNWLVDPAEILEGGPGRDGIPAIDKPTFIPVGESDLAAQAPVIALEIEGVARAYPLEILIWHEIVNDEVADLPIAVTYCPLCNAALVFRRELEGRLLDFGTTGRLRKSDLVMYDRQTESWWQQFEGRALVGELAGSQLTLLPSRLEGFASFKARFPDGAVLARPAGFDRPYGMNPYDGYDSLGPYPGFADLSALPEDLAPMTYVIAVGNEAWPLERLQREGRIEEGDLILQWTPGAASALDSQQIDAGRDLGNVVVMKGGEDQVYDLTFAFVFLSFRPEGVIHFQ